MGIEGWLAATALAVWLLGIVTATALVALVGPTVPEFRLAVDLNPAPVLLMTSMAIVAWPPVLFVGVYLYLGQAQRR